MSINFETLRKALKSTGLPVCRDLSSKGTKYPYIVYSIVSQGKKVASGKTYKRMPYYQISLFTTGTEKDLAPLEKALENIGMPYLDFTGISGDENDDTVTNFFSYVRCIESGG